MCDLAKKKFVPPTPARVARREIHELDRSFHCAILGTCLTLQELHKLVRQTGINLPGAGTDYDAHRALVGACGRHGHPARRLQRLLDRKYRRFIQQLDKLHQPSQLQEAWCEAVQRGDIAGTFWALATHPSCGEDLMQRVYGEVHMLSHLTGAANRADLRRLSQLEQEVEALKASAAANLQRQAQQLTQRDHLIAQLEDQLLTQSRRATTINHGEGGEQSAQALCRMRREYERCARQLERSRRRITHLKQQNTVLQQELNTTQHQLEVIQSEHQASEQVLSQLLFTESDPLTGKPANLQGRQVVYVGGRPSLSPHFRALVEQLHGEFEHHDGGLEENRANLHCLLGKADMVFCPIDCVSHDACLRVKRFCKQHAKPFIPLRSSGLSAFARELSQLKGPSCPEHPTNS